MVAANQIAWDFQSLAEQAARELVEAVPTLKTAHPIERSIAIALALHAKKGSVARLADALSNDPSFGDLCSGWIQHRSGFGMRVEAESLSRLLLNSALEGHPAEAIVEEARALAASRASISESYTPLAGVTVTDEISLGAGIDLIPWPNVPDGPNRVLFQPDLSSSAAGMTAMPNSAIRIRSNKSQILFPSYEDAESAIAVFDTESTARIVQIQDVMRCITAVIESPVAALGNWAQFDNEIANRVAGGGYSYSADSFDRMVYIASFSPATLEDSIVPLLNRLERFRPSEKSAMRIALDRLNQALRGQDDVGKAIDLGIALEVMLLHGMGKGDRGELRFRSAIRGATFLSSKKQERLQILKLLRDAYDLRSKAVHSGIIKQASRGRPPNEILQEATSICAQIGRKVIERGSFPDWDSDYVVGGL